MVGGEFGYRLAWNGVSGHIGVGVAEAMFDREGMTSGIFHRPLHLHLSR